MPRQGEGTPPVTAVLGGGYSDSGRGQDGACAEPSLSPGGGRTEAPAHRAVGAGAGAGPLPCQNSNNSTEAPPGHAPKGAEVGDISRGARTAFALQLNVQAMCSEWGLERVGFLTLTFAQHILCPREAQRRMNSLTTHVLRPRYGRCIRVIERQKSGRIHYHLLVALAADIRTGCDFEAFAKGDYRSAPAALRAEWSFWRQTARRYGFGRTELLPVRSSTEAIGRYVGKYIAKHLGKREPRDKGVRLVTYTGAQAASVRFAWVSPGATAWRQKLGRWVEMMHAVGAIDEATAVACDRKWGPKWLWYWRDSIMTFPLEGGLHVED